MIAIIRTIIIKLRIVVIVIIVIDRNNSNDLSPVCLEGERDVLGRLLRGS